MVVVVTADDKKRIIERMDAPDFNAKDIDELKRIFREDGKYWAQHEFWGCIYSRLLDYTELYLIRKNMGDK